MLHEYSLPYTREDFPFSSAFNDAFGKVADDAQPFNFQQNLNLFNKPSLSSLSSPKSSNKKQTSKQFVCTFDSCNEKFPSEQQLEIHRKFHEDIQPFICDTCGKVCKTQKMLTLHEESHKKDAIKPICTICDRKFSTKSALNKHTRMIHDRRPYKCPSCQSGFEKAEYLAIHAKRCFNGDTGSISSFGDSTDKEENSLPKSRIQTSAQLEETQSDPKVDDHSQQTRTSQVETAYPHLASNSTLIDSIPLFSCHMCSSTFPYSSYLQQHMSVHYSEKQPCQICGVAFSSFRDLANHLRTHTLDEQSKVTLDFSGYGDSSYFHLPPFPVTSHQTSLPPIQYQSQSFPHQFMPYQQQQPSQSLYFPPHSQQTSAYSQSFQYSMPFYSDRRSSTSLIKDNSDAFTKPYNSFEFPERDGSSQSKYVCHRCRESFLTYSGLHKHQERCLTYTTL